MDLVINTVSSDPRAANDSLAMRRAALQRGLPYFTTLAALRAAAGAIRATAAGHDRRARAPGDPSEFPLTAGAPSPPPSRRRCARFASRRPRTSPGPGACGISTRRCRRRCAAPWRSTSRTTPVDSSKRSRCASARRRARGRSVRSCCVCCSPGSRPSPSPAGRAPPSRARSRRCPASGRNAPRCWRGAASRPSRICSSTCRRATTTARSLRASASSRSGCAPPSPARCWLPIAASGAGAGASSRRCSATAPARSTSSGSARPTASPAP